MALTYEDVSIQPSFSKLLYKKEQQIAKNQIKGPYKNIETYLNTHFHLLRYDFIQPIREDLRKWISGKREQFKSFIIHKNVMLLSDKRQDKTHVIGLDFKCTVKQLEENKRFLSGSLVYLITNNFKRFIPGRVRDVWKNHLTISFMDEIEFPSEQSCSMIECLNFFVPYNRVLKVLRKLNNNRFPMPQYIIEVDKNVKLPEKFWSGPIKIENKTFILDKFRKVEILPNMNESQTSALKAAFLMELCLIQGPPGTGKTYVATKIVQTFMDNLDRWYENRPILIVSSSNRALDQMLEKIIQYTTDIVRVGNQSKSIELQPYFLNEIMKKERANKIFKGSLAITSCQKAMNEMSISYKKDTKQQKKLEKYFSNVCEIYEAENSKQLLKIFSRTKILGMTTTAAAGLRATMEKLGCPVVIVEEAAEILESHIVASVTKHCRHLILIGDHRQLRPTVSNCSQETLLSVSLFERLVLNGLPCHTLTEQFRMRPEFCQLITPMIYETLTSHSSVSNREPVSGICNNLYFIEHENPEEVTNNVSKKNEYEAKYLLELAKFLVHIDYDPKKITILATYSGQVNTMEKLRKNHPSLRYVQICTVDSFQGEENHIILLSLVRNNAKNEVGFLSMENRICVALSRAKYGFYIMGNLKMLREKSEFWASVHKFLLQKKLVGSYLSVYCPNHLDTIIKIRHFTDFSQLEKGICKRVCNFQLPCGHRCSKKCHRDDHKYCCDKNVLK